MSALAPGFDPLIAEAKVRMRRRRVLLALLVLLAGAGVLFLILRPSGAPGTSRVTTHGGNGNGNALAHLKVPVDATEMTYRARIRSVINHPLTPSAAAKLERKVVAAVRETGASVVRIKVWPRADAVEFVVATTRGYTSTSQGRYLSDTLRDIFRIGPGCSYLDIVDGRGEGIIERTTLLPRHAEHDVCTSPRPPRS